jgi:hypothetical protein
VTADSDTYHIKPSCGSLVLPGSTRRADKLHYCQSIVAVRFVGHPAAGPTFEAC